jgi:hypothetical protein
MIAIVAAKTALDLSVRIFIAVEASGFALEVIERKIGFNHYLSGREGWLAPAA